MSKLLSAVVMFLFPYLALAAAKEIESAATAPTEMVDVMYVVIFGILFFGMIVAFFIYFWWVERKRKKTGE